MKRPAPVYRTLKCHKCGGELRDWDCYCTWGCDACNIKSECSKCGHRSGNPHQAEVETDELKAWKEWCRQRSVAGQKKAEEKHKAAVQKQETPKKRFKERLSYDAYCQSKR